MNQSEEALTGGPNALAQDDRKTAALSGYVERAALAPALPPAFAARVARDTSRPRWLSRPALAPALPDAFAVRVASDTSWRADRTAWRLRAARRLRADHAPARPCG